MGDTNQSSETGGIEVKAVTRRLLVSKTKEKYERIGEAQYAYEETQ